MQWFDIGSDTRRPVMRHARSSLSQWTTWRKSKLAGRPSGSLSNVILKPMKATTRMWGRAMKQAVTKQSLRPFRFPPTARDSWSVSGAPSNPKFISPHFILQRLDPFAFRWDDVGPDKGKENCQWFWEPPLTNTRKIEFKPYSSDKLKDVEKFPKDTWETHVNQMND